jgi:hypothetical protein
MARRWKSQRPRAQGIEQWVVDVSTDYPQLMKKLAGHPRRFAALTRTQATAEARGFVDSLSIN